MRITIVQGAFLPVPPILGGAVEKVWFNLGKEFARRGHEVVHLSRAHPKLPKHEVIDGVRHERVSGFASPGGFAKRMAMDLWYALRIKARLPRADILITNTFWLPALVRRRSRGRVYVHVARYPKRQMWLYRRAILQTVSEPIRQAILAEDPSAAPRVRVIPYPLANRYLLPEVSPGENIVLYTGRVHPEKGVHLLIEAFAKLAPNSDWRLKIVGPWEVEFGGGGQDYLKQLESAAAPVKDRVMFVGREFDEAKLIAHYATAKIFVYPSLAEKGETFGLAALEAMAAGCCPLVSALECFRDFIRPDENGRVFDHRAANPVDLLARALESLITDPVSTEKLRREAWQDARAFTMEAVATRFIDDFIALTGGETGGNVS
ncbi:MAG TPA: glycosyltransferase family 4 protein [Opitutaceae bacterium]|nr:glycosyltransferase family 4 protein [Opitutaceae bacterium]